MSDKQVHVIYAKHTDRSLHKAIRGEAYAHDLTISEFVVAVMRYFLDLPAQTQQRALQAQAKLKK